MTTIKDVESAMVLFESSAIQHSDATERGDYKTANKSYKAIEIAVAFLKGENEIIRLGKLLTHSSLGVRGWVATYLLPYDERNAIRILEEIAKGTGIHSLNAETILSEWRKGNFQV